MIIAGNNYNVDNRVRYNGIEINNDYIQEAFDFAWDMSFGRRGMHRDHRAGGRHKRKNGEIFVNTFQGKLSEFAIYQEFTRNRLDINYPDLDVNPLGQWDNYDFMVNNNSISIKSTKSFGNLLLLECEDWDVNGRYIPNMNNNGNESYDYFILVRISSNIENSLKKERLFYSNDCDYNTLQQLVFNDDLSFDIPGYLTIDRFVNDINNGNNIIHQGNILNGRTTMDADNYYYESGELQDINNLYDLL